MIEPVFSQRAVRPGRGFTLVELLVAMSLLSLVMLAMLAALRTAAQTEERVDRKLQSADELRLVSGFLREVLGRISVQKTPLVKQAGDSPYFFSGEPNEVSWLGVLPARHGVGGRHHLRLFLSSTPNGNALAFQYAPWTGPANPPDWRGAGSSVLLEGIQGFGLEYLDSQVEPPSWSPRWTAVDHLPDRVRVSIRTSIGDWPEVVVAMRGLVGSDPSMSGPVFGGGAAR